MPAAGEIIDNLTRIAAQWHFLAVFWHAYFGLLIIILLAGYRLPARVAAVALTLPVLSAGILAWLTSSPFNGVVFVLLTAVLLSLSFFLVNGKTRVVRGWRFAAGTLLIVFGWVYPHFTPGDSVHAFLYSSPLGLIPCPTLAVVAGFSLTLGALGSIAWAVITGVTGIFYGVIGAVYLGIHIDWILLFGGVAVLFARDAG